MKEIPAPIKPKVKKPLDTTNFDEDFKKLSVFGKQLHPPLPNHKYLYNGNLYRDYFFGLKKN